MRSIFTDFIEHLEARIAPARFGYAIGSQGLGTAYALDMVTDSSGNVVVVGHFFGNVDFDPGPGVHNEIASQLGEVFIGKYSRSGDLAWVQTWGSAEDYSILYDNALVEVALEASGDIFVSGTFGGTGSGFGGSGPLSPTANGDFREPSEVFVLKLDGGTGAPVTTFDGDGMLKFGGEDQETADAIAVDETGSIYVTGYYSSEHGGFNGLGSFHTLGVFDAYVIKLNGSTGTPDTTFNGSGFIQWGGTGFDFGTSLALDGNGSLFVAGTSDSKNAGFNTLGTFSADSALVSSGFLLKINAATGVPITSFQTGGAMHLTKDFVITQKQVKDGGLFTVGITLLADRVGSIFIGSADFNGLNSTAVMISKISTVTAAKNSVFGTAGAIVFGSNKGGYLSGLVLDKRGKNLLVAGADTLSGNSSVVFRVSATTGESDTSFNGTGSVRLPQTSINGISTDNDGNLYTAGSFDGTVDFDFTEGKHTLTANAAGAFFVSKTFTTPEIILVVPGILGSMPRLEGTGVLASFPHLTDWLNFDDAGEDPVNLQLDPLGHSYDNLVATLKQGEASGLTHVVEAPYDWRRSIDGPNAANGVDIVHPDTGVEYLIYWVNEAAKWWVDRDQGYDPKSFQVDIVAHSMGGLLARTLLEAPWYSQLAGQPALAIESTDFIDTVVMLDTPNHGAPSAYEYLNWLYQIPHIAAAGTGAVIDKLTGYAAVAVGVPPVFTSLVVSAVRASVDLSSADIENAIMPVIDRFTAGLKDLLPTWTSYDSGGNVVANSWLNDLNSAPNLAVLAARAEVWNLTGYLEKPTTVLKTQTIGSILWKAFNVPLNPLAIPGQKGYGTSSVLYPYGDPGTKPDADRTINQPINQFGAFLDAPGIHNGTAELDGFTGGKPDGLFYKTFISHQLFGDDPNVQRAILAATGIVGLSPIHPFTTYDGFFGIAFGIAIKQAIDWRDAKIAAAVKTLEDVVEVGWNAANVAQEIGAAVVNGAAAVGNGVKKAANGLKDIIVFWDPAEVVVSDASGRRVGSDGVQSYNEIPGAFSMYDGVNGFAVLPPTYTDAHFSGVTVTGHGTGGEFNGWVAASDSGQLTQQTLGGGVLASGAVEQSLLTRFGTGSVSSVSYTDADGSLVTATISGGTATLVFSGTNLTQTFKGGKVTVTGNNLAVERLELTATNSATKLGIAVKGGDGFAELDQIIGTHPLGALLAPFVDLGGDGIRLAGDGLIGNLKLHDLRGGADVLLPGSGGKSVTLNFANIHSGSDVTIGSPIGTVTARQWTDGTLSAPSITTLTISGASKLGLAGDFGVNLTLTGVAAKAVTLGAAKIAGSITGGTWTVHGVAGVVAARNASSGWTASFDGKVSALSVAGDFGGSFTAQAVQSVTVGGNMVNAHLTLTAAFDPAKPKTNALGTLITKGSITNTEIRSKASIGAITAASLSGSRIFAGVAATVGGLPTSLSDFENAATIASVVIGSTKPSVDPRFSDSDVAASSIGKIQLVAIKTMNGGSSFGVAATSIAAATLIQNGVKQSFSKVTATGNVIALDNFLLTII